MKFTYLVLDILVFIGPLILSALLRVKGLKTILVDFLTTFIIASPIFIIWDIIFTSQNFWGFNSKFVTGLFLFNLPVEELLFFFCIPFATIAIYEAINLFSQSRKIEIKKAIIVIVILSLGSIALVFSNKIYTFLVVVLALIIFLFGTLNRNPIFKTNNFWYFMAISFIPFIIVNSILTSLPVVIYSSEAIVGLRIFTIPIEDFFYSFALLSFYFLVYNQVKIFRKDLVS